MNYIDYGEQQRVRKEDVQIFMDVYAWLYRGYDRHSPVRYDWESFLDKIHERWAEIPHYHYSSILGPYCVACHCNLPGPGGEWQ